MSLKRSFLPIVVVCLGASAVQAQGLCDPAATASFNEYQRLVDSLHADKPSQVRVVAADGSVFTAGQAMWMKAQMSRIERACSQGDKSEMQRLQAEVMQMLKAHQHA